MTIRPPTIRFRRGFTLIEVLLAAVLGALVIGACLALFSMMDRAKRLQNDRLETNTELAFTHKVLQQAFRTLLMESAPEPKDDEMKERINKDLDEASDSLRLQERREDAAIQRFALQPDPSKRSFDGSVLQTIDLTLTTPPVHAVTRSLTAEEEEIAQLRQLALARNRTMDVWADRNAASTSRLDSGTRLGSSSGSSKSGSSSRERNPDRTTARAERLRNGALGLGGGPADDRISALASQDIEPPKAPGVRGVFEFRQEDDPKVLARLSASGYESAGAWSLWWKQIPPDDELDIPPADTTGEGVNAERDRAERLRLIELARASRTDTPETKLLSGISNAQWQVYRRRKMVTKMAAAHAKELPAYVNFKFDTVDGRHQDWLFEVAWSYGQEPGTVLAVNDPLGAPFDPSNPGGGGDIAAAVQAALDAANGGGPNGSGATPVTGTSIAGTNGPRPGNTGSNGNTGSTGSVAGTGSTGGTRPSTGNSGVTGGNGRPIIITLPDGSTITIPANAQPGR